MTNTLKASRSLILAVLAVAAVFLAWAWQNIATILQKGISDGASMRVSLKTSCSVSQDSTGAHFTGCNSIL